MTLESRRTEAVHPDLADLDQLTLPALVQVFVDDQQEAVRAVHDAAAALGAVVEAALPRLQAGGRLIYAGAGTSGRLGMLDATELTPTFSWPPERAVPLIAGGMEAVRHAVEGAEDDHEAGAADIRAVCGAADDVLLAVAASGTTPYALGAVDAGRAAGMLTVGIANNPGTPLLTAAHLAVLLDTGPEVISGSTRLKAGTAQKIALNTISSALMVQLGKVYGNLMVDMRASNQKLHGRALRMVKHATGADDDAARTALSQADGHVKIAIVMLALQIDAVQAAARLAAADGHARLALNAL